jgi:decaprenylphospho-beta-D-erythro-pentofuranosid-2-ulose 2-reductase
MRRVLIIGATSPLARYMAHEFAKQGDALFLAARDEDELERVASDVRIRFGTTVYSWSF